MIDCSAARYCIQTLEFLLQNKKNEKTEIGDFTGNCKAKETGAGKNELELD
jgi:hypothetical protein